jgi:hypothetical protein
MLHNTHASNGARNKQERNAMSKMITRRGFENESVAYALAAGFVTFDDQDGEKARRRARFERRKRKLSR